MFSKDKKLILASKSPRRSQLLSEAGISFEIRTREVEETYPDDLPVDEVPIFLAEKKARALEDTLQADEVILAADCVVIFEDTIFGKPKDRDEAISILQLLSGKTHRVISGVCLLSHDKIKAFAGISIVHFHPLTLEEIEYYVDKFQPYDKAGAYAIQEWIGLCKVAGIEGTYSNIVGLPVDLVYREWMAF